MQYYSLGIYSSIHTQRIIHNAFSHYILVLSINAAAIVLALVVRHKYPYANEVQSM